ncbi:MAG: D-alanyl-D-alanine carboxypeptidase [Clostridia bacterium]|nr:D-alanyl-D-alanine carboxypeptidase [Clostridia bacterium]
MKRKIISIVVCFLLIVSLFPFMQKTSEVQAYTEKGMAVIERDSGRLLYSSHENVRLPMASTTKIATCITVIENCEDLDKEVAVPDEAVGVEGSSVYLKKGEKLKIRDLLYGLMLRSGNDCATALAVTVGKSIDGFARMMNETAQRAGAQNTNFTNPHGLHDEGHYTTALDLARISAYAMKNDEFLQIVSTKQTRIQNSDGYCRVLTNKNKMLTMLEGANGIKTGYTKKAGRCLVSSASRDDMTVICVVLDCPDMFNRSAELINRAFDEYSLVKIIDKQSVAQAGVEGGKSETVHLAPSKEFAYPLKNSEKNGLEIKVSGIENMTAPVKKGIKNGKIEVFVDKQLIFFDNLFTIYNVESKNLWDKLKEFLQN